jgi:hypothetical protein
MKLYLYEGLNKQDRASVMLWESAGRKLVEAQLTADQITQLFQQIQTAKGNRTLVGKGVDAGSAVMKAYNDLKTKISNSGPIQNMDAMYDQAAEKLKQATGGDQGAMSYVQKYRDFAKAHPVAQSFIYGALIAAAGISGAGAGGAAALGLFKMVDKLLQGEKFSSAAYSGAKTGAMAYAAGQIGKAMKGGDQTSNIPTDNSPADYSDSYEGYMIANQPVIPGQPLSDLQLSIMKMAMDQGNTYPAEVMAQYAKQVGGANESRDLSRTQVLALFERVARLNSRMLSEGRLEEGIWDDIKSGAGKGLQGVKNLAGKAVGAVAQGAAKVGRSMTANVSSDALTKAWQAAGSPTDSAEIEKLLQAQGVNPEVIKTVFQANSIPLSPAAAASTGSAGVDPNEPMPDVMSTNRAPAQQATPTAQATASRLPDVSKLTPAQKQQLLALVDKRLRELTAKPKVPYSAVQKIAPVAPTTAKISPAPKPGAPTPAEQAKLQQKIQAAMQAQQP